MGTAGERLAVVGVMGSGEQDHAALAEPLGAWLGTQPVHLLTGGGGGVMEAVGRGFAATPGRRGRVIGVLPASAEDPARPPPGYPGAAVEIAIRTHLPLRGERGAEPLSRNHVNVLSADLVIALPGGPGTASEIALARVYERPLFALLGEHGTLPGLGDDVPRFATLGALVRTLEPHIAALRARR